MLRTPFAALLAMAAATMLTGCSGGIGISDLDRAATETDGLPAGWTYPDSMDVEFIEESARLAGAHDDSQLWLMRTSGGLCLVVYADGASDHWACSGGAPITMGGPDSRFTVIPDDGVAPEGAVAISENVYAH
ncbi:hypothetical protein [Agrococcus sp. KRD186]|uniref:hypothetical protein n=1 Tax=Agrococcus sp. KRD186 TaxID=2729730 RepID=UPI0019CFA32E|nr:hypothetical protein [Agrococcus sp. KRD186]